MNEGGPSSSVDAWFHQLCAFDNLNLVFLLWNELSSM